MNNTYRLGETKPKHAKRRWVVFIIFLVIVAACIIGWRSLKADTQIGPAPKAVTTRIDYETVKTKTFTVPQFSIDLPEDWKPVTRPNDIPPPAYVWQGTLKENAQRYISVYVDQAVSLIEINLALHVQAGENRLNVLGDVSDNCINFTGAVGQNTTVTPAKWQGIDFLCDSGNYQRDVVGTVSPDGINNINLSGPSGTHRYFVTYTDNSISPNYDLFTAALRSLRAK